MIASFRPVAPGPARRSVGYTGSKGQAGTFQRIIGQMRPHSHYVEAFFGTGKVFWEKTRALHSTVIDVRADLIAEAGAEAGVSAVSGDAISWLAKNARWLGLGTVVYCDPPYPADVRGQRVYYRGAEMDTGAHLALLKVLNSLRCDVLLSGYPSDLYSCYLQGWRCCSYSARTRGRTVTECLWMNFAEPDELHDWRFAGKNFRERLYLRRLAARWLARLEAMRPRQRGYLLNAITQRQNERGGPAKEGKWS